MNATPQVVIKELFEKTILELIQIGMPGSYELIKSWTYYSKQKLVDPRDLGPWYSPGGDIGSECKAVFDALVARLTIANIICDHGSVYMFIHAHHYDTKKYGSALGWISTFLELKGVTPEDSPLLIKQANRGLKAHIGSLKTKEQWLQAPISLLFGDGGWVRKFVDPEKWYVTANVADLLVKTRQDPLFNIMDAERIAQKLFALGFGLEDGPFLQIEGLRNIYKETTELMKTSPTSEELVKFFAQNRHMLRYL